MEEDDLDALLELRADLVAPEVDLEALLAAKPGRAPRARRRWAPRLTMAAVVLLAIGAALLLRPAAPGGPTQFELMGIARGAHHPGDTLVPRVHFKGPGERPFVYLLHVGSEGARSVLVPGVSETASRLPAPDADGWSVLPAIQVAEDPPFGNERLALVLSPERLDDPFKMLGVVRGADAIPNTVVLWRQFRTAPKGGQ